MRNFKTLILLALVIPTLAIACGSLDYWAKKYIDGSDDKKIMLQRMSKCLKYYPFKDKQNEIIYEVFSDAINDKKLLKNHEARKYLEDIFFKSNCMLGNIDMDNYIDIKREFGVECTHLK